MVGARLGAVRNRKNGADKRVRYWALGAHDGSFCVNDEVDDLVRLPADAAARLARHRDRAIIDRFQEERPDRALPLLLVRHGQAVPARRWVGADRKRPLNGAGRRQASALAPLLDAYGVRRALAADVARCRQTLQPIEKQHGVEVERVDLLSRDSRRVRARALRTLTDLAMQGVPAVVCADKAVLLQLCAALSAKPGTKQLAADALPKAAAYALHLHDRKGVHDKPPERVA